MNQDESTSHKNLFYILLSAFLLVFAKNWEPGLGVSSTTYGAFAKNILATGNWFHFSLAPGLYDPFVDHPYLVIWMDAVVFKLFGISAQSIRLASSIFGLISIAGIYGIVKNISTEKHAVYTYVSLLTVTVFFNFMASGWLDMPMIAFTIGGFYFYTLAEKKNAHICILFAGLSLSCAFLAKGFGALGIIPIGLFILIKYMKRPTMILTFLGGGLLPVALFTALHYHSEGFFFWDAYLKRQFGQNTAELQWYERLWYFQSLWDKAFLVILLFPFGIKELWKKHRSLALLICGQIALHTLVYSMSARQYSQYTVPVFPWLAICAGYYLSIKITRWEPRKIAKGLAVLSCVYFVAVDILPVRVHSGSDNPYRSFSAIVSSFKDTNEVAFIGTYENQDVWEIFGSYISWYYDKIPHMVSPEHFETFLGKNPKAIAVVSQSELKKIQLSHTQHKVCAWNEELALLANHELCPAELQRYRPIENNKQSFTP